MTAPQQPEIGRSDPRDPNRFVGTYLAERPTSPWRSRPAHWAIAAAAIAAVVCLVGWPRPTLYALGAVAGAIAVVAGIRGLIRGPKTITAPTDQQVTAQTEPAADQAAGLRCVCGDPVEWMTHPDGSGWIHSPGSNTRCLDARPSGTSPDASGSDPETARTHPDAPEVQPVDQPGHDPDDLRTRLTDAIRDAARNCDSKCGLTEDRCAAAHPIQVEYWTDDVVSGVAGPVDALADIALTVIRPERCCSCGSNDVVYHNFREQPFCSPCADGDRPAMHRAAEQQIREAAGRLLYPVGARVLAVLDEQQLAPPTSTRSNTMPTTDNFQDRGDAARRAAGIDGTAGDAQDIRHRYAEAPAGGCLLCGLAPGHRKHIDRPLGCGFCFEEDGEEIHPHPECPRNSPVTGVMQSPPQPPTPRCPECDHPMGDHSVHTLPRPTWCHACNTTCAYLPADQSEGNTR